MLISKITPSASPLPTRHPHQKQSSLIIHSSLSRVPSQTGILQLGSPSVAFKNRLSMHNIAAKKNQKVNTASISPQ